MSSPNLTDSIKIIRNPFPSDAEGRLDAVLSIINREPTSIILAKCMNSNLRDRKMIVELYSQWAEWPTDKWSIYCFSHPIVRAGFAEEYMAEKRKGSLCRLTDEGCKYGVPIACAALKLACKIGNSLYLAFGKGGKTSPPTTAARILKELYDGTKRLHKREADLCSATGLEPSNIANHLERMEAGGFVEYNSANPEERGWARYYWNERKNPDDVPAFVERPKLTLPAAKLLMNRGKKGMNCHELAEELKINQKRASKLLSHMARNHFAEKTWVGGMKCSDIFLTDDGLKVAKFVYEIEEALGSERALKAMEERSQDLPSSVTRLAAEFYRQVSPGRRCNESSGWINSLPLLIEEFYRKNGIWPRAVDVVETMQNQGYNITGGIYKQVSNQLNTLVKRQTLIKNGYEKKARYRTNTI